MNIEQRLLRLEEMNSVNKSQIEQINKTIVSMRTSIAIIRDTLENINDTQNKIINQNGKFIPLLTNVTNDTMFVTVMLYWLCHILERVESITPVGTMDLMINSTEENIDPKIATFYSLFDGLRNASAG